MINDKFNEEALKASNEKRRIHGVPEMKYSSDLAKSAQEWADEMAATDELEHSETDNGENIAMIGCGPDFKYTGDIPVAQWYSEIGDYNFEEGENQMQSGHFSQMVWKITTHCGFGCALSTKTGSWYGCGHYDPPGNFDDEWQENIPPPAGYVKGVQPRADFVMPKAEGGKKKEENKENNVPSVDKKDDKKESKGKEESKSSKKEESSSEFKRKSVSGSSGKDKGKDEPLPQAKSQKDPADKLVHTSKKAKTSADGKKITVFTDTYQTVKGDKYDVVHEEVDGVAAKSDKKETKDSTKPKVTDLLGDDDIKQEKTKKVHAAKPPKREENPYNKPFNEKDLEKKEDDNTFGENMVDFHNNYRKKHGVPALKLNNKLCEMASEISQRMRDNPRVIPQSPNAKYKDENVGMLHHIQLHGAAEASGEDVVNEFYSSKTDYDFNLNDPGRNLRKCSPFTQMVWKDTKEIGVARSFDRSSTGWFVIVYYPAGNIRHQFRDNVFKPNE